MSQDPTRSKTVDKIVCAIRGGDGSRRAQERAIALAQAQKGGVVFVHVVDADLIHRMDTPLRDVVRTEMQYIGASLLSIAAERALARGVKAETVTLYGSVSQALEDFLRQSQATLLVLGLPDTDPRHNTFDMEQFRHFVDHLRTALAIKVETV